MCVCVCVCGGGGGGGGGGGDMTHYMQRGHSMSNQRKKKTLTPPDLDETWFLHSVYRDIN